MTRVLAVVVGLLVSACGASGRSETVFVSAAASLTDAFSAIETGFESAHPGTDIVMNFAGSATLRQQILDGAPVDVFASANPAIMAEVEQAGRTSAAPRVFARNSMQIATPPGNPAGIAELADFADPRPILGLCAEGVPCGDLARQILSAAGVEPVVDSHEADVRALLTKIEAGEIDAGLVYRTDVLAAGDGVEGIPIVSGLTVEYPIVLLADAPNPSGGTAFIDFVLSAAGQEVLSAAGFGP